jgi:hypothetical protein
MSSSSFHIAGLLPLHDGEQNLSSGRQRAFKLRLSKIAWPRLASELVLPCPNLAGS